MLTDSDYDFMDDFVALQNANARLRSALALAIRQNSHDMLLTAEELRVCEDALGKARAVPKRSLPLRTDLLQEARKLLRYAAEQETRFSFPRNDYLLLVNRIDDALSLTAVDAESRATDPQFSAFSAEMKGALYGTEERDQAFHFFVSGWINAEREFAKNAERLKDIAARLSHSGYDQERDELIDIANSIRG